MNRPKTEMLQLVSYTVDSDFDFPFDRCSLEFDGRELAIYSGSLTKCDIVETIIRSESEFESAFETVSKFLDSLALEAGAGYEITNVGGMGLREFPKLPLKNPSTSSPRQFKRYANVWNLKIPQSEEARMALSIYNEAIHASSCFYRFLCQWRILEIPYPNQQDKNASKWINRIISERRDVCLTDYIKEMQNNNTDVGQYFYNECRNAIAHITRDPTVVGFKWSDHLKIIQASNSLESFVRFFIRNEIDLQRYSEATAIKRIVNPSEKGKFYGSGEIEATTETNSLVGPRLKLIRRAMDLSLSCIARDLGTSQSTLARIENGKQPRDITLVPALCKYFGVSLRQLTDTSTTGFYG